MRNLSEVARLAGCSRAALSKFLVNFRDTYGFGLIAGKLQGSRAAYREGQLRSLRNSTHSSFCRKDAKTIQPHKMVMNTSVEPKTLDAAKTALEQAHDEIAQLKAQLASRPRQNAPATTTAASTPSTVTPPKLTLSDLSKAELMEALDLSNKSGDTEMVKTLYRELQSSRRGK